MAVEIDLCSCGAPAAAALDLVAEAGVQALEQLRATIRPEQLEQAVDLLAGAEAIHIVGQRRAFAVAAYLAHALGQLGARAHLLTGTGGTTLHQANLIARGHVVLAVSFAPHALETLAVAHEARERGVPLIVLADGPIEPAPAAGARGVRGGAAPMAGLRLPVGGHVPGVGPGLWDGAATSPKSLFSSTEYLKFFLASGRSRGDIHAPHVPPSPRRGRC